jgi:four helix bundle protein
MMEGSYRNRNRGYQQLRVWQDATDFYAMNSRVFRSWPFELKKVASQAIASADSVHRNIAEGYARRSLKEYIQFLYIAAGSLAESVSGFHAYAKAEQITTAQFDVLTTLAYKLENGLLRLIESLERKKADGDWVDTLVLKDSNEAYDLTETASPSPIRYSKTPSLQHSVSP